MKKTIITCLAALLLAGCGIPAEDAQPTSVTTTPTAAPIPQGCYVPDSGVEQQTGGAVRLYAPGISNPEDLALMGSDLLVFSSTGPGTRLTVLTGEDGCPVAERELDTYIDPQAPSTLVTESGVSYFDSLRRETVLLDEHLREILRVSAPEGMTGEPIPSHDRMTLYYLSGSSICALDLETGIPRTLRQLSGETGELLDLIWEDTVVVYFCDGITQFLSAQTGQILEEWEGRLNVHTTGKHYQTTLTADGLSMLVFGSSDDSPKALAPTALETPVYLPASGAVLNISGSGPLSLDYYDLDSGLLRSALTLDSEVFPAAAGTSEGILWLLLGDDLYRWDTRSLPTGDDTVYTSAYHTRSNPDLAGIARCQALAREIGERHGVEILVWEDAVAVQPWDYHLTEEFLVPLLEAQLEKLDRQLANFPEGFFSTLSESFQGLSICLVRQLRSSGITAAEDASGLQFWAEDHAYIALSTIHASAGSLYHELCHVMDTRIFAHSNAYDQWEDLNPSGFSYDYDYVANATRNAGEYLRDAERCFIDTYSMSFPKEDRARILEYAMTEGNEHYFQSKTMQSKLRQLCIGIREGFGLKKSPDTFLWEQYLQESLAYTK